MGSIYVNQVSKAFYQGENNIKALTDIEMRIAEGSFVSIVGPSGSGKSTLLHLLGTLDTPSNGKIYLGDDEITSLNEHDRTALRGEKIGFIFQQYQLIATLTAMENVMIPLLNKIKLKKAKEKAISALEEVGLKERINHLPSKLSGGEQQRVAIARALVISPQYIFADEPTGNLDSVNSHYIMDLLKKINNQHQTTIVVVTHDINIANQTDKIYNLLDGKLII